MAKKAKIKSTRLSVYVPWPLKIKLNRLVKHNRRAKQSGTNLSLLVRELLARDVDQELATRIQIVQKKETPVQMSKRRPPPNDIFCSKRKKGISSFIKLQKQFGDIELTVYETKF